jgi:hypothetical protein
MPFVPDKPAESGKFVADPLSRESLEKDLTTEDYRIPGTDTRIPGTGKLNQFLISTGRGMVDLWAGANQLVRTGEEATEYTREQEDELALFEPMQREAPITSTVGRIVGQAAPMALIPGGAAASGVRIAGKVPYLSLLSKAGVGTDAAVVGGLQGFLNFVPEGDSRGLNTVLGAGSAAAVTKGLEYGGRAAGGVVKRGVERLGLAQMAGTRPAVQPDDVASAVRAEGIDWDGLTREVKDGIVAMADDAARGGAPLTPAEIARIVRAQNLPGGGARLTKGQMTGDRVQLRDEFNLRRTNAGQTLDDQLVAQDEALVNALDVIKLKTGGATTAGRDAETGRKITGPLLEQLRNAQARVDALYKAADESGATLEKVNPEPLLRWLEDNFAAQHSAPAMRSLAAQLKKSGLVQFSKDGDEIVAVPGREITIREAESLRQAMNQWGKGNDASGHWMGEAKRVLDGITEGKGGAMYAKARAARIELREQFEDPGIINRLVSEKAGGDRKTAFEDVFKATVLNGSVDDLVTLRGQLLRQIDKEAPATAKGAEALASRLEGRDAGVQAFKDLRAATLDYLKMGAMRTQSGDFSLAGFRQAVENVGVEKLEVIFGKNTTNQIMNVLESAKDMKAPYAKEGIRNPGTASAIVDWLDKITGLVGLGRAATYASGAARKVWDGLHGTKAVAEASDPVKAAMQQGAAANEEVYRKLIGLYGGRVGARSASAVVVPAVEPELEQ